MKYDSVHLNVHTQIVFLNCFKKLNPALGEVPRWVTILESCNVQNLDNQVKAGVCAHIKESRNKWQPTAGQSQL
jgi:hypothetical protein